MNANALNNLPLRGGFLLTEVAVVNAPMIDAMGRRALARTTITGMSIRIELAETHAEEPDWSISLYHEVLEACAVASPVPPESVCELNEGDFEQAAQDCFSRLGSATPLSLNEMLAEFGF